LGKDLTIMKKVPRQLIEFIENHECFYILGHREPDGDCVGSQLALASFLKSAGKRGHLPSFRAFYPI